MVSHPAAPVALWHGTYGNAKVIEGQPYAITSDGVKHAL